MRAVLLSRVVALAAAFVLVAGGKKESPRPAPAAFDFPAEQDFEEAAAAQIKSETVEADIQRFEAELK